MDLRQSSQNRFEQHIRSLYLSMKPIRSGFTILHVFNGILISCRCSLLCLIACCFNASVFYLLPLGLVIDWAIAQYSYQSVFRSQLRALNKAIDEFQRHDVGLEIVEDDTIRQIDTEMRKYQLFQWGDKYGRKQVIVVRVDQLFGQFKSFVSYCSISVIFVPRTFYPQSVKDRILLAHEFAHCVSHDLMLVLSKLLRLSAILLPLIVLVADIPVWIKVAAILSAVTLRLLSSWPAVYNEIEANNHALEVIKTLYGADAMAESAKYLLRIRTETMQQQARKKKYRLGAYIAEQLQIKFLQKCVDENRLIWQISPMNTWLSAIYYGMFIAAGYGFYSLTRDVTFSWQMLAAAVIAFVLVHKFSKINIIKIWKAQNTTFAKIGL